ncbi:Ig-like domain-containing protein [Luteolibacter soli]|uniref:Ig-like domain-containing protein n=1 Tax=Luteolibacter soli TaxID=3135280 RepID=A0ABU9AN10_9BACT
MFARLVSLSSLFFALFTALAPADEVVRIMAANISSGNNQSYDAGHGNRIFDGLNPDVALVQEMNVGGNSAAEYRAWVNAYFGSTFSYFVESGKNIPNGIVSRYPILASGVWDISDLTDREFVWARIDLPGDMNLLAVSVHLKSSSDSASRRQTEAQQLAGYIAAEKKATDHVVIGGDFNTYSRTESCVTALASTVVTTAPWPADQSGNTNTNAGQSSPYDWVMPSSSLAALSTPLVISPNTHTNGLVFDSRDYTPLSAVSPVQSGDSGATGMQHMAVMRAFLIPTNEPPVITAGTSVAVTLSRNNTPTAFSRSLTATDADSDPLTWTISTAAAHGTAGVVAPATGGTVALSYTPTTNYTGSDSFVVRVADGQGGTDTITVNLTIEPPPNTAPVITQGDSVAVTMSRDGSPTAFSRSLNATDADGNSLTWSISTQAAHGTAGVVAPATGGTVALSYVPVSGYTGTDSFIVRVSDGQGGTDTITVNLTIQPPPNVAPVIAEGDAVAVTMSRDGSPTAFSRSLNATDSNSDPLAWSIFTQATHGTAGVIAPATGGAVALSYAPLSGYTGTDSFVVRVSDGQGGTDTITVNVTIQPPPNVEPVIAQGDSVSVTMSRDGSPTAFQQSVSATDSNGDALTWSVFTQATHGTAGIVAPASGGTVALSYLPVTSYTGTDSFVVRVSDGEGGTDTIMVNVTIDPPPNVVPVIVQGDSVAVEMSRDGYPGAFQLTVSATDADNDPLSWTVSTAALHGTAVIVAPATGASPEISYQPADGYLGADSFRLRVSDGQGGTDEILVQVTVVAPSAYDDWTEEAFAPLTSETEATVWGEDADPDGDGMTNLEEFARGTDPAVADSGPALISAAAEENQHLLLSYLVRLDGSAPALDYMIEASAGLAGPWTPLAGSEYEDAGTTDLGGGFKRRTIRLTSTLGEGHRFFRLAFTR